MSQVVSDALSRISIFDEDKEQLIASRLNTFLFQKVWNEPVGEFRNNIVPMVLSERSVKGIIRVYGDDLELPTLDTQYYLYAASKHTLHGVSFPYKLGYEWIRTDDLANSYGILLHIYHTTGLMLPKQACYIYRLRNNNGYLVAINKLISETLFPYSEKDNVRFTVYFDSDVPNPAEVKCFTVPHRDSMYTARTEIMNYIRSCTHVGVDHITVYINGYETKVTGVDSFPTDCYVDVIHDENVITSFDMDLTDPEQNKGFYSVMDKTYKQLVHIPKALNPENKIFTHNTMDIFVRKKDKEEDGTNKGLFLHRCANRSVTQVTHNDIAIPMYIVDAYRDYLETPDITLHIVIRQHSKDNVLIRDKNYIDLLYTLDDATIVEHLTGRIPIEDLKFWHAEELEQSVYLEAMFDVPDIVTPSNMTYYIEGLGYYHVMSLLTEKITTATITEWFESGYAFPKPYIYQGSPIYPIVYLDGVKVDSDKIVTTAFNDTHVGIGFTSDYHVPVGSLMSLEMFLDGVKRVYAITPESGNSVISLPYGEFDIIEELDFGDITVSGFDRTTNKGYKPFTEHTGNIVVTTTGQDTCSVTFGPRLYGRTFIIQPVQRVYRFKQDLAKMIEDGSPLILDLDVPVEGYPGKRVPVYHTPTVLAYLNGRYLTEGVDFTIQELHDYAGNLACKVMCIQNVSWLNESSNSVEYFITSASEENKKFGYSVDDTCHISGNELALYFPKMTAVHVDGRIEHEIVDKGNKFDLPHDKHRQGALCEFRTSVPEYLSIYLSRYHINDDLERIRILNEYFYGINPDLPDIIVLEESHICYSIYTATVVRDILNGNIKGLSYDPDIARMEDQVKSYKYLALADLVNQRKYDLRFVDVSPHYRQFTVDTPEMRRVLQAFIKLTMPEDDAISNKLDIDIVAP